MVELARKHLASSCDLESWYAMKQQRFPRRVGSRRAVIIGVAGLVTAGLAGGALAWLRPFSHIAPVKPASTQRAEPSPTVALGTAQPFECLPGTVVVAGSSVLAPLIRAVARDYRAKCPNGSIEVEEGGSLVGLAAVDDMFSAAGQAAAAALKFFPLYEFTPEALTAHQSC
jgi:ABC-type phosphate transport system substrate-binding protein